MTATTTRILILVVTLAGVARAQPATMKPAARAHLQRGLKLYQQEQYDAAIAELREGLAIDPQPDILYALGQTERKRGDCARAVEYYQSCLALVKDPAAAAAVKVQIERCRVAGDGHEHTFEVEPFPMTVAPPAPPPPVQAVAPAVVQAPPPPPPRRPAWRDPLGAGTVALGLGGIVTGGVLVGLAKARLDLAGDSYQHYSDARGWPGVWIGGIVTLGVSGAILALGATRYAVVGARARRSP